MGKIHLKCLRNWLQTKCTRKVHRQQTMIKFKKLDCELCKVNFPFKISFDNQIVDIVEVETPEKNFIVFESLSSEAQKIFYIINTENLKTTTPGAPISSQPNHEIKIGRGADSDVRVTDDISVSRAHAYIQKSASGEYYINDNQSKFGTLLLVQQPIFIGPEFSKKPLVLQSGKTQLSFQMQLPAQQCLNFRQKLMQCCRCCFPKKQKATQGLITLNGRSYFPQAFMDYKTLGKAKVIVCDDSDD